MVVAFALGLKPDIDPDKISQHADETYDAEKLRTGYPETNLDRVAGCMPSKDKTKTSAQMRAAVRREVMRRRDRGQ